ncbi:MAG: hypothetical protein AVDCRST_MAG59-3064 [uncultured Thermomicrobiales bacterium]|uniref:Uncharacterized protein n=1 Tax=uncultured Thermomicrobiales bacterium TaxID=1645740 RepID=A0A6J4V2J9_9BACT|nr:MAG: hypothetical protein AVDCRST_MAG59-3064 [uncultured Thermomicrobiales bacterium]
MIDAETADGSDAKRRPLGTRLCVGQDRRRGFASSQRR